MAREQLRTLFDPSKAYVISQDGVLPGLSGRNLTDVRPAGVSVEFWSADIAGVLVWNQSKTEATVTHPLNCLPIVNVYDGDGMLVRPDIRVVSGTQFKMIFDTPMTNIPSESPYVLSMVAGSQYGEGSSATGQLPSAETMARTWAEGTDEAVAALGGTHSAKGWTETLAGYIARAEELNAALAAYDGDSMEF